MDINTPVLIRWLRSLRVPRSHRSGPRLVSSVAIGNTSASRRERLRRMVAATGAPKRDRAPHSPARIAIATGTTALLTLLLCIHLLPSRVDLHLGDIADQDIVAQRSIQIEDTAATDLLRREAAGQVERRYESITGASTAAHDDIQNAFDLIDQAASEPAAPLTRSASPAVGAPGAKQQRAAQKPPAAVTATKSRAERIAAQAERISALLRARSRDDAAAGGLPPARVTAETVAALLRLDAAGRKEARRAAVEAVGRAMQRPIVDDGDGLTQARLDVWRDPSVLAAVDGKLRDPIAALAAYSLRPNRHYDAAGTDRDRSAAEAAVQRQYARFAAGQPIIRRGDRVTHLQLDALTALGLQNARIDPLTVGVFLLMVGLLVTLVAAYLRRFHRDLYEDPKRLLLLALLSLISVLGLKIGSSLLGLPFTGVFFGYLGMMCVASAGMVIALLISPSVATLIVGLLSIASGLALNGELRFTVITLVSSLVGIVSVARLRNRGDLLRAALTLCTANVVLNVLVGQIQGDLPQELVYGAIWGIVYGLFALVLFYVGVAAFEKPFGITTHLRLLELTDPATPILQEFRLRVPGTYAHSLMVANLAHAAADAVGADSLLVRVAAYYHDLGKMNRPEFFIENQANAENVHDRLSPSMSALILSNHVKEGLEMAEVIGLPPRVRDVIREHHGTSLMRYFYHRATGGAPAPTLEAQFRYPGPKPQTREAAILMLADGVEAASRTLEKPTPARISEFVGRMIQEKLADGQLDDCDLTMRDLKAIQDVFSRTLAGTLHARIEYPDSPANMPNGVLDAAPTLTLVEEPAAAMAAEPAGPDDSCDHGTDAANGAASGQDAAKRPLLGPRARSRAKTARGGG